jgi:protein TonB
MNDTYDFEIGRALHNLPALREIGFAANRRLLHVESLSPDCLILPPPPPPSAPDAPLRVGGNIRPPTKITDVRPVYPPIAQAARVEGMVIIETIIGPTGRVLDAKVIRSIPLLDAAALEAVRQWEFTPTLLNGSPVPVVLTVTVHFALR